MRNVSKNEMMKKKTQKQQVVTALEKEGGYATLRRLNEIVDFSTWKTNTPEATVRRIVQESNEIFKIRPGLWALESHRKDVLHKFNLQEGDSHSEEQFSHAYYQGLLVEIGKLKKMQTYVPAQDKNRLFLGKPLADIADTVTIPAFTYEKLLRKARTIDVIWFNQREMPSDFYEVEHTTDIKNSLSKFYELQDFFSRFYIVADACREKEFQDKINVSMFDAIEKRVRFINYDQVASMHAGLKEINRINW